MGVRTQALKSLHLAWHAKVEGMRQLNQVSMVRPRNAEGVIRLGECVTGDIVKVDCGPAVFKLCEKAGGRPDMYVVVSGSICLRGSSQSPGRLQTMWFGTRVGYFRWRNGRLMYVHGVHYDMDERGGGHPVFHGQLGRAGEFASVVEDQFRLGGEVVDCVGPVLRNVRTPTAQMDFFSVCTQLCADHLMAVSPIGNPPQVIAAFDGVRSACDVLQGAAHRLSYLNAGHAPSSYRSSHWYGA